MRAKVTKEFPGLPDNEVATRTITVGETILGSLAKVAVDQGWATEIGDDDDAGDDDNAGKARKPRGKKGKEEELRNDGPTVEEYVKAGYRADAYPPLGYSKRSTDADIATAIAAQQKADEELRKGGIDNTRQGGDKGSSQATREAVEASTKLTDAAAADPAAAAAAAAAAGDDQTDPNLGPKGLSTGSVKGKGE